MLFDRWEDIVKYILYYAKSSKPLPNPYGITVQQLLNDIPTLNKGIYNFIYVYVYVCIML